MISSTKAEKIKFEVFKFWEITQAIITIIENVIQQGCFI